MEKENEKFLKDSLFYLGFGERLHEQLEESLQKGKPEFKLNTLIQHEMPTGKNQNPPGKDSMFFELNFKKGKEGERYFFNSYKAQLVSPGGQDREQVFYINKNKGVTTKEAYNLLSGRAVNKDLVNKEGEKYNAWLQLNFGEQDKHGNSKMNVYHEKYGYEPEKALGKLQLVNISESQKDGLIHSLKKGNLVPVAFLHEGRETRGYIAANPKYRNMRLFDENGKSLVPNKNVEQKESQKKEHKEATEKTTAQKEKLSLSANQKPIKVPRKPRVRQETAAKGRGIKA